MWERDGGLTFDASGLHADCIVAARWTGKKSMAGTAGGPEWRLEGIAPGLHAVRIRLIPSTFNTFGPHHHRDGDRHLTSPMQYSGEKGFADTPDAPSLYIGEGISCREVWNLILFERKALLYPGRMTGDAFHILRYGGWCNTARTL